MATCKDCFNFGECLKSGETPHYAVDGCHTDVEKLCKNFKNKSDYAEVKHGTWSRGTELSEYARCSACNRKMNSYCYGYAYCPLCGAKMDGGKRP